MTIESGNGGALRRTEGRGKLYDSISTRSATRPRAINRLAPPNVEMFVKCEFFNPAGLGQGPPRAQHHRGGRARGQARARPDRGRGDERQHRHRSRDGLRRQGLSARRHHGRQLLAERRQLMRYFGAKVVLTPRAQKGFGMYLKAKELAEKPTAGSSRTSSRPTPTPTSTRAPRRRRSSPTSPARSSTISSPATAPAARWRASGG